MMHETNVPQTLPGAATLHGPPLDRLEIVSIDPDGFKELERARVAPICDLRGAAPKQEADFAAVEKGIAGWTLREEVTLRREKIEAGKPHANLHVGIGYNPNAVPVDVVQIQCATGKPLLTVNGVAYPGDVLYGEAASVYASTQLEQRVVLMTYERKTGQIAGVNLVYATKLIGAAESSSNDPWSRLSSANVLDYIPATAAEPIVHIFPVETSPHVGDAHDSFEMVFVVPGPLPRTGVFIVAPNGDLNTNDVGVNRFIVKDLS